MYKKKIFKAVALLTVFSLITRILGFVFRIVLSRELSPTSLGIYQIASSIFGIFCALVSSGLPLVISRKTAEFEVEKNKNKEQRFMLASLIIGLSLSLICCLAIVCLKGIFLKFLKNELIYSLLILFMPAIIFSSIYSVFRGNMWGHKNYFWVCFIELIEQVVRILVCFIIFSKISSQVFKTSATALSMSIACIVSGIIAVIVYFIKGGRLKKPKGEYKEILKATAPITLMHALQSLVQPIISILVPLRLISSGISEGVALAEIGVVMGMTFPLLFVPSALVGSLATALIPEISASNHKGNNLELKNQITSALRFALACSFLLMPIYGGLGKEIGLFVFGNENSGIYLSFSCFLMVPICLNTISATTLNSLGMEGKSFKNYIIGSVCMLISLWFLPKYIGVYSLSIGMGICLISSLVLNIRMLCKKLNIRINIAPTLLLLIIFTIIIKYILKFTYSILMHFCPMFISLALCTALNLFLFALLLDMFGIIKIFNIFVSFKRKIFKNKKSA